MPTAQVRYIVQDVETAIAFYIKQLGFQLEMHPAPPFAMLSRGDLRLVLSAPNPSGGGGQPMPDGTQQEPGGWNRFAIEVSDLAGTVEGLRQAGARFRNDIVTGVGGKQIIVEDPSGNPVELFEPILPEARLSNRSAAPGPVVPTMVYEDVGKAIDWLCETFGFVERFRYGPEGKPAGAQLSAGEGSVFLTSPRLGQSPTWDDHAVFRSPRPDEVTHTVSVHVEDVDRHYEHAKQHGARILNPPETYPFGERQYTAEDLGGHRWTFTQSVADVAPEDWGGKPANPV